MESRRKAEEAARLQQEQRDRAAADLLQHQLQQAAQADQDNRDRSLDITLHSTHYILQHVYSIHML